ncbi:MAG: hypothetical protein KF830_17940 [Planctomycetes bacterium]|nr:hypothetical protein [Planctomycetota bacterium]
MGILASAATYFAVVFGAGFVLGAIRVPLLVPRLGERTAELLEMPIMVLVIALAARWRQRRTPELRPRHQLAVGALALLMLLAVEIAFGALLAGKAPHEVLFARDPVAGASFAAALLPFALAPAWWARHASRAAALARRGPSPLDGFLPHPDVQKRHAALVKAPADVVFAAVRAVDLESMPPIRCLLRLRARLLGTRAAPRPPQPFLDAVTEMGWCELANEPGRILVFGAACQPWLPDVRFEPVPAAAFAAHPAPGRVLIAWSIAVEPVDAGVTRLTTETRVLATDAEGRARFRRYWRWARFGIVAIRRLLLPAIRRRAEADWRARCASAGPP